MAVYQGSTVIKRRPKDGKGVLSVTEYYLATNLSEGVTQGTLGWTANPSDAVLTPTNKYLWRYETTIYTDGTSSTTNPVIIGTYGEKGDEGLPGPIVVQKEWVEGDTHRYTDEIKDYIYVRGDSNDTSYWYTLANKGTVTADVAPTGGTTPNGYVAVNWMKELALKFLIAEEANLANFVFQNGRLSSEDGLSGLNGIAGSTNNNPVLWAGGTYNDALSGTAKAIIRHDGSVKFTDGEFHGTIYAVDGEFSGEVKGVTGSFKRLYAVDDDGNIQGLITFREGGQIEFDCDIYSQGYNVEKNRRHRYYASDIWCRGTFGAAQRNTLVVYGTYGRYFTKGLDNPYYMEKSFTPKVDSNNNTYYIIPLYEGIPIGVHSGFAVDLVIINHSTPRNYDLQAAAPSKVVIVINSNDAHNDIWIYCNGVRTKIAGGVAAMLVNVGENQTPDYPYRIGRGWFVVGMWDNNW